jgi:hypothetical protein
VGCRLRPGLLTAVNWNVKVARRSWFIFPSGTRKDRLRKIRSLCRPGSSIMFTLNANSDAGNKCSQNIDFGSLLERRGLKSYVNPLRR